MWLERRAPTGENGGWDGDGSCIGLMLAGAVSVDGNRYSRGDVLVSCTDRTVVRVVSNTAAVFLRGCAREMGGPVPVYCAADSLVGGLG